MAALGIDLSPTERAVVDAYQKCIEDQLFDAKAFEMSKQAIKLDVNDYSAWWLRRRCIESDTNIDLNKELEQARIWIAESPKNYQAWYHRRWLMQRLPNSHELFSDELSDLNDILDDDSKNHNAWQYRQWMVSHFSIPIESEYEMVEDMIISDCNNNSAWNYREWLCQRADPSLRADVIKREVKYATVWLERCPSEAIVNYLLGMFRDPASSETDKRPSLADAHPKLKEVLTKLAKGDHPNHFVTAALASLLWAEGELTQAAQLYKNASYIAPVSAGLYKWRLETLEACKQH